MYGKESTTVGNRICRGRRKYKQSKHPRSNGTYTKSHEYLEVLEIKFQRSALAYHSGLDPNRRNIGISTSSTTSRSTTKTSSSPYRSDTHLRHTSTSTSNYNSTSDVPSYMRGFEHETSLHRHREGK